MRPAATSVATDVASRWTAPVLFSVVVHISFAAGYVLLDDAYTPPRPPTVFPIEVVLMADMPGARKTAPTKSVKSAARPPAAPAESQARIAEKAETEPEQTKDTGDQKTETVVKTITKLLSEPYKETRLPAEIPLKTKTQPETTSIPVEMPRPVRETQKLSPTIEPMQAQPALFAPLPKRKPVLTPPPIRKRKKAASRNETAAIAPAARAEIPDLAASPPRNEKKAAVPAQQIANTSADSMPSTASAGAATARLTPPSYAAPGRGNPLPAYPRSARRRGVEGRLILRVEVGSDGHPGSVTIVKSSGHPLLDRAAKRAVKQWSFEPGRRAGIPVNAILDVPVVFRLQN